MESSTERVECGDCCDRCGVSGARKFSMRTRCEACSYNQGNRYHRRADVITQGGRISRIFYCYSVIGKTMTGIPFWSTLFILWMGVFMGLSEGLQCYECLSLSCESGAACDAIKSTMVEIFVPKRHFIHFDPSDICPENELPLDSMRWANLSRECERSDSICLVSPIEVHTVVDGKLHGKMLENEYTLMTHGYLRGCASRRKLLEFPETINVRVEFAGRNESGNSNNTRGGGSSSGNNNHNNNANNNNSHNKQRNRVDNSNGSTGGGGAAGSKKKSEIFYNMTNIGNGAELEWPRKTYKDGYSISKIYSHVFYIDQGTNNATRCYADNCNDKVKFRRSASAATMLSSSSTTAYLSLISSLLLSTLENMLT